MALHDTVLKTVSCSERPTCDAHHASNWRLSPNIYSPYTGWLHHSDPNIRNLVEEFGSNTTAAEWSHRAWQCAVNAPWEAADAEFFGKETEHYEIRALDWNQTDKVEPNVNPRL